MPTFPFKFASTFLIATLLAACGALPSRPITTDPTVQVERVDATNAVVTADASDGLQFAVFPLIQGSLSGPATTDPVLSAPVRFGYAAPLPLAELSTRVAPLASPASAQMLADGLTVVPAETRLARVAAFFVARQGDPVDIGGGFLDEIRRETLFLVYFDRPSSVTGIVTAGQVAIRVDVAVQGAGLYWLHVRKDDPTHWRLSADDTSMPIALVTTGRGSD